MRLAPSWTRPTFAAAFLILTASASAQGAKEPLRVLIEGGLTRMDFGKGDAIPAAGSAHDFKRVKPGIGFNFAAVIPAQSPFLIAGGIEYTSHSTTDSDAKLGILVFYFEPRVSLPTMGRYAPYAWLRAGYVHASQGLDLVDDEGVDAPGNAVQTGPEIGGGLGLRVRATDHVHGFLAVGYTHISLGDIDFDFAPVSASKAKGGAINIRLGVLFDFAQANAMRTRLGW